MTPLFIGPMSQNIVDAVCDLSKKENVSIGFIPSRRQVEYNGGYVHNWTTTAFKEYVRNKNAPVIIQRDHAGALQGLHDDNGRSSYISDCENAFDLIHVDPWKKYKEIEAVAAQTIKDIQFCISHNSQIRYEIGTEAAIREYTPQEFYEFISLVREGLGSDFEKIEYAVIQGGTAIIGNRNIGVFNSQCCEEMSRTCKEFGLRSKEHNGDYLTCEQIKERFKHGLDAINIAPEFGALETQIIINHLYDHLDWKLYNNFYNKCYESKRWVKWLPDNIESYPTDFKKHLILRVAGHYVFSSPEVAEIKNKYLDIDTLIQKNITERIKQILECIKEP